MFGADAQRLGVAAVQRLPHLCCLPKLFAKVRRSTYRDVSARSAILRRAQARLIRLGMSALK